MIDNLLISFGKKHPHKKQNYPLPKPKIQKVELPVNNDIKTAVFYQNDLHSSPVYMDNIKINADTFERQNPDADKFKVTTGDMFVGKNDKYSELVSKFMALIGTEIATFGDHEFDNGTEKLQELIEKQNEYCKENKLPEIKYVVTNLDIDEKDPLYNSVKNGQIRKSLIVEKNGHKYGFVGAMPVRFNESKKINSGINGVSVKNLDETITVIQEEVKNLEKQGVNKIFLLSHLGKHDDIDIANHVSGIDKIFGGHSHNIIGKIKNGRSKFMSPSDEPVTIVQAGKGGNYSGITSDIFDSKGVIKSADHKLIENSSSIKDIKVQQLQNSIIGKPESPGYLKMPYKPFYNNPENPLASFLCDAMKYKSGADIALIANNSLINDTSLNAGAITTRDIDNFTIYKNNIYKARLTGQEIVDLLNWNVSRRRKPSPLQVSGLMYNINTSSNQPVKDVLVEKKDGLLYKINPNKKYNIVYDDFILNQAVFSRADNVINMLKSNDDNKTGWNTGDAAIDYIKSFKNKPFEIELQGRIAYSNNDSVSFKSRVEAPKRLSLSA